MNPFTDIIQRCHQRHREPLRQRKTVAAPALYKGFPYCFKVYCAQRYPVILDNLEQADLSFMPIGRTPENDERVQSVYEQNVVNFLAEIIGYAGLDIGDNRKVMLITSFPLPGITDRSETLLFDWEDFEVAGSLDKLPEVIATREQFEAERANLTAESSREEVERVLGCSARQANRVLKKFRGGRPLRVPFREQILSHLSDGEKKAAALVAAIDGHPKAINNELTRLVEAGEIVKIRRGIYALP